MTRVLATTNEVSLKGGNRKWFERKLTENVRRALADLPVDSVARPAWRVLITLHRAGAIRRGRATARHRLRPAVLHARSPRRPLDGRGPAALRTTLEGSDARAPLPFAAYAPTRTSP